MTSTDKNLVEFVGFWLEIMNAKSQNPFLESGCETRVNPYVPAMDIDGQSPEPEILVL